MLTDRILMRRLLQLACISLLLFAQQVGLAHAVWHAAERLHSHHHDHAAHEHAGGIDGADGEANAGVSCTLDLAFGEVLGAIGSGDAAPPQFSGTDAASVCQSHPRIGREPVRAVSRGPPLLS